MDNQTPPVETPQQAPVQSSVPPVPQVVPQPQAQAPAEQPVAQQPVVVPQPAPVQQPEAPVTADFSPIQPPATRSESDVKDTSITWSAQEYIHPDKTPIWYFLFGFVVLGFVAIDIFLLRSWTFSALVIVMAIAIMVYIRRPARTLTYALSASRGLYVGEQLHSFEDFKSFGLITADGSHSIMLVPRKRFAPGVSVYFPAEAGEQIVDILGSRLPMEELKLDMVDIIVRKLRL